jgi:DNA-binding LacI/PurR family transcriptional regulator
MRVTQQDIAKIANVSQATVSRVLAGDDKVEASIRKRVGEVMRKHNYQPDVRARSLRNRRTGLIGLVVQRPVGGLGDDPFFARLVAEIIDRLSGKPYHLCLDMVVSDVGQQTIYEEMLRTRRVDGLILVESETRDARINKLEEDNFPFVLIGNPLGLSGIYSVDNDNVFAGEMATRHLIDEGFQRIGFLGGRNGITVSDDRIAGYQRAVQGAGLEHLVWHSDFGSLAACQTAVTILSKEDRPEALVVLDDFMAMGVVLAARDLNLRIPHDIAIVGFNDSNICDLLECGLTSVSLNISSIVDQACSTLLSIIEGNAVGLEKRCLVPCDLRVRGSSVRKERAVAK